MKKLCILFITLFMGISPTLWAQNASSNNTTHTASGAGSTLTPATNGASGTAQAQAYKPKPRSKPRTYPIVRSSQPSAKAGPSATPQPAAK